MIRAVVFDVGECLVDESREYGTWADWLGVPRHTFSAVFGAVIAQGRDYRETFQVFRPGLTLPRSATSAPPRVSPNGSAKRIFTRTFVRRSRGSAKRGTGSVSRATRPVERGKSSAV
jgi:hypothetical protein